MDGGGDVFNRLGKRLCLVVLSVVMISNAAQQGPALMHKDNAVKSGMFESIKSIPGTIKRRMRKLYDCVMGNDETCTPDEIIITRAIAFLLVATTHRAMAKFAEQRRLDARQLVFDNRVRGDQEVDLLNEIRLQEMARRQQDSGVWMPDAFHRAIDEFFRMAQEITSEDSAPVVDENLKTNVKNQRSEFLDNKHHSINVQDEPDESTKCCVCLEDDSPELNLDYIPCNQKELHSDKLCLGCLSRLVMGNEKCPICRAALACSVKT